MKTDTVILLGVGAAAVYFLVLRPKRLSPGAVAGRSTPNVPVSPSAGGWAGAVGQIGASLVNLVGQYIPGGGSSSTPWTGTDPNAMLTPF